MGVPKFSDIEKGILQRWKDQGVFALSLKKPAPQGNFVFFEGPPTANGRPHMGHVETRAFKDVILRYKTMRGYRVERRAGWDAQGLPVELEIEKDLKLSGKKDIEKYGIAAFNAKAKESVWKYKELWEQMTERVGFWIDFADPYITYANGYIETLWWILKQTWDKKLLVQDYKVVPYCPRCGTALSSHEVAQGYQTVTEPAVYVKFALVDEPKTFVLAWTTTPWTLPGNVALAVDEKTEYVKVQGQRGEHFIVAKALVSKLKPDDQRVVATMTGKDLVGKGYQPLFEFLDLRKQSPTPPTPPLSSSLSPVRPRAHGRGVGAEGRQGGADTAYCIAAADFVTTDDGTGIVHTAVMYGEDDFQLGKKLDLPKVHTVDEQGRFTALVKPWAGLEVRDAEGATQAKIIQYLEERDQLYRIENYTHEYPFCWRCKHALLYYAKTSWFILMSKMRDRLMANNQKIQWIPGHIKDGRFGEWVREVKDWAISRERYWGTPLPIWICDSCGDQECFGSFADLAAKVGSRNRYILARHGEAVNNIAGVLDTMLDDGSASLTPRGREQSKKLGESLRSMKIDAIYSSQFPRAKQSAEVIGKVLGLPVAEEARINEYLIGPTYENKTVKEFHEQYGNRSDRLTAAPTGGETWIDIQRRFFSLLQELEKKHNGKTFLLLTHADPILMTQWAASFQPEAVIPTLDYPGNGQAVELRFPAALFAANGEFDPHRPFIDDVTFFCQACKGGVKRRVPDVADAWFDSGSMPFAQWHYPFENKDRVDGGQSYPAEYITEAIDQTRGWFYTLLAVSALLEEAGVVRQGPPYKNVIVLGHVRDAKGQKLSKSLGNYIDPLTLVEQYGADPVRFYLYTMNQPGEPKNFDVAGVDEIVKKTFLILMNVVSFWKLHPIRGKAERQSSPHPLDRWIDSQLNQLVSVVTDRLEAYDPTAAGRALAAFITDLSTWYIRRSRDRFKGADGPPAQAMLQHVLLTLSRLLAPFTPFLAEEVYRQSGGKGVSVHLENWPQVGEIDRQLLADMAVVRQVVEQSHALRAKAGVKVRQPLSQLVVKTHIRTDLIDVVREELNVREVHVGSPLPSGLDWLTNDIVGLDTTITDELREAGLLRDLIREMNALRRTVGLKPSDKIIIHCQPHTLAAHLIERYQGEFLGEVNARAATPSLAGAEKEVSMTLGEETVRLGLSRS